MLNSIEIENFRSFKSLSIPRLGMVNLIVGKNNAGKSTVLEAVRILSGNANRYLLDEIAESHDEVLRSREVDVAADERTRPYEDFFFGRNFPEKDGIKIKIGDQDGYNSITLEHVYVETTNETVSGESGETETVMRRKVVPKSSLREIPENLRQAILVTYGDKSTLTLLDSRSLRPQKDAYDAGRCGVVPTTFISMNDLARDWDRIALTEYETLVKNAVRHIVPNLEGITFVEGLSRSSPAARPVLGRVARVKLLDERKPVPLSSLGDGMLRVFQMTLRAFSAKNGYLLIDEFENGLHYTIQEEIWNTVFELSASLNMQVFATTHSWDCIKSFAAICQKRTDVSGILFRVGRSVLTSNLGQVIATIFDKNSLQNITQADLEVR